MKLTILESIGCCYYIIVTCLLLDEEPTGSDQLREYRFLWRVVWQLHVVCKSICSVRDVTDQQSWSVCEERQSTVVS